MDLVSYPAIVKEMVDRTTISFPDLPAANIVDTQLVRALRRAEIGLAIVIIDLQSHNEPVPAPTSVDEIMVSRNEALILITTDLDKY